MRHGWAGHGGGWHRGRWMLAAIVLAFACLLALAPRAHGARSMEVAIQDDPVFVADQSIGRDAALKRARELGATRVRVNLSWATVVDLDQRALKKAPADIKYDFSLYDPLVEATRGTGIAVQFALVGPAPAFATGDKKIGANAPKARYFKDFAGAAARHYKGGVDRFSIWNEPNYVGWLAPLKKAPKIYRALYTGGYAAIKAAHPKATVLIAETSPYKIVKGRRKKQFSTAPIEFMRQMTCSNRSLTRTRCKGLKADGYAHHPYDFDHKPTFKFPGKDNATLATLGNLTRALDKLAKTKALTTPAGKPLDLYLTEYGYFASGKRKTHESKRSKYLPQAFKMAQRHPRVKEMLQYLLVQPPEGYRFFDTSIMTFAGDPLRTYNSLSGWSQAALRRGDIAGNAMLSSPQDPPPAPPSGGGGEGGGGGGGGEQPPPSNPPPPPPPSNPPPSNPPPPPNEPPPYCMPPPFPRFPGCP
jgi:hypothetical protein